MYVITHLSKLIEYTKPRLNPVVNYGLWVITNTPFDIEMEEAMHEGAGDRGETSVPSSPFTENYHYVLWNLNHGRNKISEIIN